MQQDSATTRSIEGKDGPAVIRQSTLGVLRSDVAGEVGTPHLTGPLMDPEFLQQVRDGPAGHSSPDSALSPSPLGGTK